MPELPEAEAMRSAIAPDVVGKTIVGVWGAPHSTSRLVRRRSWIGKHIVDVERHGKVLSLFLREGGRISFTLGMSGRLLIRERGRKHDRLAIMFNRGTSLVFNDFRRFGRITYYDSSELAPHKTLGPDALSTDFSADALVSASARSIKTALLDQKFVAGLGNIYTCESLFHARIHPHRPVRSLTEADRRRLVKVIKEILQNAVERGGSTLNDYRETEGEAGDYDRFFAVFGKSGQSCPGCTCSASIVRLTDAGRSTFVCLKRQK
jgi:formamidopyrimidine-DNA glycosylase